MIGTPPPVGALPVLEFKSDVTGSFAVDSAAERDSAQKVIRTPISGARRFYRISFEKQVRITHAKLENGRLVLTYE